MKKTNAASLALTLFATLLLTATSRADVWFNSIRLGTADVEAVAEFYSQAFGLHEVRRLQTASGPEIFLNFGASVEAARSNDRPPIVLMPREADDVKDPMAHLILNVSDMAATVEAVKRAGGTFDVEPREYGNTGIMIGFAVDPAGNLIELIQPAP